MDPQAQPPRRLERPPSGLIAGVCAGLSDYFGINLAFTRITFILLALFNGVGIVLYLILLVAMPLRSHSAPAEAPPAPHQRKSIFAYITGAISGCAALFNLVNDLSAIIPLEIPSMPQQAQFLRLPPTEALPSYTPIEQESETVEVAGPGEISPELQELVGELLNYAVQQEILAYSYLDASYVEDVYAGAALSQIEQSIEQLSEQGVYFVPELDASQSRWVDIRLISDSIIEVDSCEVWSGSYYRILDHVFVGEEPAKLLPQTLTIEVYDSEWFITAFTFYESATFCQ